MPRQKPARKEIHLPIYKTYIVMLHGIEALKKTELGTDGADKYSGFVSVLDGVVYIWFEDGPVEPNVIVHESLHAAWAVLSRVGVDVSSENHEALAYLLEFIYERVVVFTKTFDVASKTSSQKN